MDGGLGGGLVDSVDSVDRGGSRWIANDARWESTGGLGWTPVDFFLFCKFWVPLDPTAGHMFKLFLA